MTRRSRKHGRSAVDGAGFPELVGNALQAGEIEDHGQAGELPDENDEDRPQRPGRRSQPGSTRRAEADRLQESVQRAVEVEDETPEIRRRKGTENDRCEEQGTDEVPGLDRTVKRKCEQKPEDVDDHDERGRELQSVEQSRPRDRVVKDRAEVAQADELRAGVISPTSP